MPMSQAKRRYPIGAELIGENQTHFRVWAPKAREVDVVLEDAAEAKPKFCSLTAEPGGYFSGAANVGAGARYRFRVNGAENFYPDPASRFQPDGPHGSSCIVDPTKFRWSDAEWPGLKLKGQIFYEMHIGTFTREGTWRAAAEQLPELARIGITVIEMMPVAEFPGRFGWGYDGVDLFAPSHLYGTPDDLRAFVDRAHSLGLGVILDVVYNHFGPDGNYLGVFSDDYLLRGKGHEWGDVINFDGPNSGPVREFFITNGRYWIEEFHFDGFRFDATHAIRDQSEEYIIGAVGRAAREAAGSRSIILIAENDLQEARMTRPQNEGGDGLDGMWNDDFHHSAIVALTGQNVGYFSDYSGKPQEFISAAKYGFLYQGQALSWRKVLRGTPTFGIPAEAFVCFIENHDQIANTGPGDRLRFQTSPGRYRAITALLLLGPWTPLLFQGQEFGASSPFLFFADVGDAAVRDAIRKGRAELLAPFLSLTEEETLRSLPAPDDPKAFSRCKLDFSEREKNRELYNLHIDLLKLRREDSRFRLQEFWRNRWRGARTGEFRPPIFFGSQRRSSVVGEFWRTPGIAPCFRAFACAAGRLQMGNALDQRFAALRRSGRRCNRNSGPMDFASRIRRGMRPVRQRITPWMSLKRAVRLASGRTFETSVHLLYDSQHITSGR